MEVVLIAKQVVLFAGIADIDQMTEHVMTVHSIVCEVFSGADVHATIDLTTVRADNLGVHLVGQSGGKGGLPTCRRSKNGYQLIHFANLLKISRTCHRFA